MVEKCMSWVSINGNEPPEHWYLFCESVEVYRRDECGDGAREREAYSVVLIQPFRILRKGAGLIL